MKYLEKKNTRVGKIDVLQGTEARGRVIGVFVEWSIVHSALKPQSSYASLLLTPW